MSEIPGNDKSTLRYDSDGLIVVPDFNSGNERAATEQEERFADVHDLVGKDMLSGRKYTIPSRSSDKVYIMKPTGEIRNGQIVMAGPDVSGNNVWERTVTPSEYVRMHQEEEAKDRAVAERMGEGVIGVVEAAADAGVEEQGVPEKPEANTILKGKIDKVVAGITFSIENAGHFDPASACGQSAEEIKRILRNGVSDGPTVAILNQAINVLEQGSEAGRASNDSRATVAALSNARTVLRAL